MRRASSASRRAWPSSARPCDDRTDPAGAGTAPVEQRRHVVEGAVRAEPHHPDLAVRPHPPDKPEPRILDPPVERLAGVPALHPQHDHRVRPVLGQVEPGRGARGEPRRRTAPSSASSSACICSSVRRRNSSSVARYASEAASACASTAAHTIVAERMRADSRAGSPPALSISASQTR